MLVNERERLSWAEICARYPDEWVVVVDMKWPNDDIDEGELESAIVLGHTKSRGDVLRETRHLRGEQDFSGHFFTGPIVAPCLSFRLP
jgi:hypothetical protein